MITDKWYSIMGFHKLRLMGNGTDSESQQKDLKNQIPGQLGLHHIC